MEETRRKAITLFELLQLILVLITTVTWKKILEEILVHLFRKLPNTVTFYTFVFLLWASHYITISILSIHDLFYAFKSKFNDLIPFYRFRLEKFSNCIKIKLGNQSNFAVFTLWLWKFTVLVGNGNIFFHNSSLNIFLSRFNLYVIFCELSVNFIFVIIDSQ